MPTLAVLRELGGSASITEIEDKLIDRFRFTPAELELITEVSGAPVILNRMAWARSYLKIAGFVSNDNRGIWVLTEAGRSAADQPLEKIRTQIRDGKKAKRQDQLKFRGTLTSTGQDAAEEEAAETVLVWSDRLLAKLQSIAPAAFERLCQRLLREHGFTRVEVTGKSGDGGIDGQGVLRVNLVSFHVLFQCKRYKGSVSSGTIRDFRGAMQGRADKGLVITTGTFTPDARREATRDGAPAIDLIDGEALCQLLKERFLGVIVKEVRSEIVSIDESFFLDI